MEVHDNWLKNAAKPENIEYVVAMDSDDEVAIAQTHEQIRYLGSPLPHSSAVRNWNAAAEISTGHLLFVISDDLFPEPNWDVRLVEHLVGFDPLAQPLVLKVQDTGNRSLNRVLHPLVTRAYFERYGLFSPSYNHLYCDTDFSIRASRRVPILDARNCRFRHEHRIEGYEKESLSQRRGREEMRDGRLQFERDWNIWQRIQGSGVTPVFFAPIVARVPSLALGIQFATAFSEVPGNLRREMKRLSRSSSIMRRNVRMLRRLRRKFSYTFGDFLRAMGRS